MAAYAEAGDVQARIPRQLCELGPDSQPSEADVQTWLTDESRWIDAVLRWKYAVPITDDGDIALLKPIVADLVAARVWQVRGGHSAELPGNAKELRAQALVSLAYDKNTGQAKLVLPSSTLADDGEAAVGQPAHSFTDPAVSGSNDRLFSMGMDL